MKRTRGALPRGLFVCGSGSFAWEPRRSAGDQFVVGVVSHHERVVADDLKSVARVEALCPLVVAPHAYPQGARTIAFEPLERCGEQSRPAASALVPLQDVEALNFPVTGRDLGVG